MENQMKEGLAQSEIMSSSAHTKRADMAWAEGNAGSKNEISVLSGMPVAMSSLLNNLPEHLVRFFSTII
ncbi:hypothetical protein BDA96_02G112800 [Sorghum bicolor]|uniref:Uncharacterized protein n=1 Tax=Sorghum bicolor TaxID=4558 RepID=A0A921RMT1_SORBI|nr:hypothetical protein BDA96_02G112800 [Sorghum bicolor]